ncbi:MATE family efflux transporter [Chloroflexota bacterium]
MDSTERDWTKGSIVRNLFLLSWPMIINEILWALGPTVDMIWMGRLGSASIAGVGVAGIVVMLLMAARMGLSQGTRALVSRFVGAGDRMLANHVAQQAFVISGIYSVVVASIGVIFAKPMLILFGLEPDVVHEGAAYLRIQFVGSTAMSFWMMAEMIMYGSGDGVTPMKISVIARVVHLVLDPFLIFGWWIFPRLGVSGAALANIFAHITGTTLGLWVLFSGRTRLRITLKKFRLDLNMIWRIVKIGIPSSISGIQRSFGNLALMWFIVPFGTLAIAAHTLCQRIEMIFFMLSFGLGMAAGVLVGQNLGAGQPGRAEKSGWLAAGLVTIIMLIGSASLLLWTDSIVNIFTPEPDLNEIASTFLRVAAVGYLVIGFTSVMMQGISGAGDTLPPMVISVSMIWLLQLPLAYLLPQITNLGILGIRWAIVIAMVGGAIAYAIYFKLGRWKLKKV